MDQWLAWFSRVAAATNRAHVVAAAVAGACVVVGAGYYATRNATPREETHTPTRQNAQPAPSARRASINEIVATTARTPATVTPTDVAIDGGRGNGVVDRQLVGVPNVARPLVDAAVEAIPALSSAQIATLIVAFLVAAAILLFLLIFAAGSAHLSPILSPLGWSTIGAFVAVSQHGMPWQGDLIRGTARTSSSAAPVGTAAGRPSRSEAAPSHASATAPASLPNRTAANAVIGVPADTTGALQPIPVRRLDFSPQPVAASDGSSRSRISASAASASADAQHRDAVAPATLPSVSTARLLSKGDGAGDDDVDRGRGGFRSPGLGEPGRPPPSDSDGGGRGARGDGFDFRGQPPALRTPVTAAASNAARSQVPDDSAGGGGHDSSADEPSSLVQSAMRPRQANAPASLRRRHDDGSAADATDQDGATDERALSGTDTFGDGGGGRPASIAEQQRDNPEPSDTGHSSATPLQRSATVVASAIDRLRSPSSGSPDYDAASRIGQRALAILQRYSAATDGEGAAEARAAAALEECAAAAAASTAPAAAGGAGEAMLGTTDPQAMIAQIRWRLAAISLARGNLMLKGKLTGDPHDQFNAGLQHACDGLAACEAASRCHTYCAILLSKTPTSTKERIANAHKIRHHAERAAELRPTDPLPRHVLGVWCFEVASMSSWTKAIASAIFGEMPRATFDDALKHLTAAEQASAALEASSSCEGGVSGPWMTNRLKLAQVADAMGQLDAARHWLRLAADLEVGAAEDETAIAQARQLASKVGMTVPQRWRQ